MLVAVLFSAGINIVMLALPVLAWQVVDKVVPTGSLDTLAVMVLVVVAALLTAAVVGLARDLVLLRVGLWLDHVHGLAILARGLKGQRTPDETSRDAAALRHVQSLLTEPAAGRLLDMPWSPVFLGVLAALHPWFGIIGAAAAVCLLLNARMLGAGSDYRQCENVRSQNRAERWWTAVTSAAGHIAGLGLTRGVSEQWERHHRTVAAANYSIGRRTSIAAAVARTARLGAQFLLIAAGAQLVIRGELTPGMLAAGLILLTLGLQPLEALASKLHTIIAARRGYRRLKSRSIAAASSDNAGMEHSGPGRITLRDVTVCYPSRTAPALRAVTLSLEPGSALAIVGGSGSGKSTLAALIAGAITQHSGAADLDGTPIARWQRDAGTPPIGYLPDEPTLLEGTVLENIARFREASLMGVARSAMRAGVHELLAGLAAGYETQVGSNGANLALRERRAVALARAIHGKPRIVVLDEPQAGLDGASLRHLLRMMEDLRADGVAVVIATQDPRLLPMMDQIVVLSAGAVQAAGPAHAILARLSHPLARWPDRAADVPRAQQGMYAS